MANDTIVILTDGEPLVLKVLVSIPAEFGARRVVFNKDYREIPAFDDLCDDVVRKCAPIDDKLSFGQITRRIQTCLNDEIREVSYFDGMVITLSEVK